LSYGGHSSSRQGDWLSADGSRAELEVSNPVPSSGESVRTRTNMFQNHGTALTASPPTVHDLQIVATVPRDPSPKARTTAGEREP